MADRSDGKSAKSVRDVMTSDPQCVSERDSVRDAARIMKDYDTGVVPVVEGGKVVGMITDRDIVVRGLADGKDISSATVNELMSRDVKCVREDAGIDEAIDLMSRSEVRRIPVINSSDELVGIISIGDIAADADKARRIGRAMEEISEAPPNN